ncbi:MAG: phosphoadenylyl-sulfate reductase [Mariprofundaceae bacterium]|nr:phosphoadenylyl-sulfate reductase [Mariprofundaceae bacterium]
MNTLIHETLLLLKEAKHQHADKLIYSCSLSPQGMVLIDLICQHNLAIRIVTLDTGRLPKATYDVMDAICERYGKVIDICFPNAEEVEVMVKEDGINGFYRSVENRKRCCAIRKIHPLQKVLKDQEAWITGRRKDESKSRSGIQAIEDDPVYGLKKYNPMRNWTEKDVWAYIREHELPYNALHDEFYVSIGCDCCTRAISVGEDPRSGRWWWENKDTLVECGLHVSSLKGRENKSIDDD